MRSGTRWSSIFLRVGFVGLVVTLMLDIPVAARGGLASAGAQTLQSVVVPMPPATVRTMAEMVEADATQPRPPAALIPFLPGMDPSAYAAAKAAADAVRGVAPKPFLPRRTAPLVPPTLKDVNCDGVDQSSAGGLMPPDTHGAVGVTQFVEIVNSHLRVWEKTPLPGTSCPNQLMSVSLAAFFGYFVQTLFDPRVVYDLTFNRWVVAAEAIPESPTVQLQFVAVSLSSDATGGFFINSFNVNPIAGGGFWDFPQVGIDEDAIIVIGNVCSPNCSESRPMFLPKARLYNGLPFEFCFFSGGPLLIPTHAPPLVLDQNARTFTVSANAPSNFLRVIAWTATSRVCPMLLGSTDIPVAPYGIPPNAPQPGTNQVLHTGDGRFANASTQVGNALWQTHTTNDFGFAMPRFYKINTATNAIDQTGNFFATGSSFDFNPSIVANALNDIFVTWSATDVANGTNPQVLFGGKQDGDPGIGSGVVFTSPTALTGNFDPNFNAQRWGDYSAVTIDPTDPSQSWGVNESVGSTGAEWSSRFFNAGIP